MTMTADTIRTLAADIVRDARECGVSLSISIEHGLITTYRKFSPNDSAAYWDAEEDSLRILGRCPRSQPGSVWGTDSGSVGGHAGLTGGYCRLNKTGVNKPLLRAIAQAQR